MIGFERESYVFPEPATPLTQRREMVCAVVVEGVVGTPISVSPSWTAVTATGACVCVRACVCVCARARVCVCVCVRVFFIVV